MLFSTTYAHNLTKVIKGSRLIISRREGESATIRYNDTKGCTFKNWTAEGMVLSNPNSKTITITMPANDEITIEEISRKIPSIRGYLKHCNSYRLYENILSNFVLKKGEIVAEQ